MQSRGSVSTAAGSPPPILYHWFVVRFRWLIPIAGLSLAALALSESISPPLLSAFRWRGIGPAATGGRIR